MDADKIEIIDSKTKSRLDKALSLSDAESQLIKLVEELKVEGWNQLQIYDVFETYMFSLEKENRVIEADIVCEVVSYIYGWCGENAKLFGRTMSNEEIKKYRESKNQ